MSHQPLWILTLLFAVLSCRFEPRVPSGLLVHQVAPSATDGAVTLTHNGHFSGLDPRVASRGQLVVFLPGTNSSASGYQTLLKEVLALGYHAVSLDYPNTTEMAVLTQGKGTLFGPLREEVITGADVSPLVTVTPANGIENRLAKLLSYLAAAFPSEQWEQYLSTGAVLWSKVVVAGYSQGAGHALYLARLHAVERVVMFSGVVDADVGSPGQSDEVIHGPASWLAEEAGAWKTSFTRFRWFVSVNDGYYKYLKPGLLRFGWEGDEVGASVDRGSIPPQAQVLTTSLVKGAQAHPSTCEDGASPMVSDGSPVYRAAWRYLFL